MNDELVIEHLGQIEQRLAEIAGCLERIARGSEPEEPNHIKPLEQFSTFDWSSIGASIVQRDQFGPTHLEWNGALWTRRSPQNKFEGAIWYSRAAGKDAEGNVHYLRLITFREVKGADPLPPKLAEATKRAPMPGAERATQSPPEPGPESPSNPQSGTQNGNGGRPYSPEKLRSRLAEISARHAGKEASKAQRGLLAMLLDKCFAGESDVEEKRHAVQLYLFGVPSLSDVLDGLTLAALDWLKPVKDSGGDYNPDPQAVQEVLAVRELVVQEVVK